jgi:hypothetical protein
MTICQDFSHCIGKHLPLYGLLFCITCNSELHLLCGTPVQNDARFPKHRRICHSCLVAHEWNNEECVKAGLVPISMDFVVGFYNNLREGHGQGETYSPSKTTATSSQWQGDMSVGGLGSKTTASSQRQGDMSVGSLGSVTMTVNCSSQ